MLVTALQAQPPAILQNGVRNSASRMPPSLGGGSIARGSRFTIEGLRLDDGPSGTTVTLTRGASTVSARLLSVSARRVEALMPAGTPLGEVSLTITRQGESSAPHPVHIVPASFGIFSRNGVGWGPGRIDNVSAAGRAPNSPLHPAQPGGAVALYGTGLGNVRDPEVLVGGKIARPVRSSGPKAGEPGVDEIVFDLPADAPQGCYIPVAVQLPGGIISNTVTMAIQAGGARCVEPENWPAAMAGTAGYGILLLFRLSLQLRTWDGRWEEFTHEEGNAAFVVREAGQRMVGTVALLPPLGICTAYTRTYVGGGEVSDLLGAAFRDVSGHGLNAGEVITVTGPAGVRKLPAAPEAEGRYEATLGGDLPLPGGRGEPLFLGPGEYRVTAQGGSGAGPFTVCLRGDTSFVWKNRSRIRAVDRAKGVTVEWSGADPARPVLILATNVDQFTTAAGLCFCAAPPRPGRFHVPAWALANVPATQRVPGLPMNLLALAQSPAGAQRTFQARGIGHGFAALVFASARTVAYH